jgi:1-acyl-sn-glycerol-3-phosphate acyltransferase
VAKKPTSAAVRALRFVRVVLHVLRAVAIAAAVYPLLAKAQRSRYVRLWSTQLLAILAVRVKIGGVPPRATDAPAMVVANHVSWLDIFAINTVHAMRFVAKSEIRHWPVIGWLGEKIGTLFIERTRHRHIADINQQVAAALRQGDLFAVFPEGKITTGDVVLPFHASLLQPALACNARLFPVAIRYTRADGSLCSEADYEGDKSLLDALRLLLTQPVIHVQLQFLPPLACNGAHRGELAHAAARVIASALNVPVPRRRTGKSSGRPA